MTRSERLLQLIDLFRNRRRAITAETLAETLSVSPRTIYRDIQTLRNQGADIRGEAGTGFVLYHDFLLPPLMFSESEIEALILGIRWVVNGGDGELAQQALSALTKIHAVLPEARLEQLKQHALYPVGNQAQDPIEAANLATIRQALREQRKITFDYQDKQGKVTSRTVLPINIGYFESLRLLAAWCELRQDFRHFRIEKMQAVSIGDCYTPARQLLQQQWQAQEGITLQELDY